jgi:hypothetical protein
MSHQIHVARSDEVIWVSLEGKNIHDFYQYVLRRSKGEADRAFLNNIWDDIDLSTHQLHRRVSSVLLGSPHLASWVKTEGAIDIEVILKALMAYRKDNGCKIIEVNAVSEIRNLSLEILDIGSKAAFDVYTDWQCIDEFGCVKTLVAGITKFKGANYLYDQWNQLLQDKRPVTCDELTTWGD